MLLTTEIAIKITVEQKMCIIFFTYFNFKGKYFCWFYFEFCVYNFFYLISLAHVQSSVVSSSSSALALLGDAGAVPVMVAFATSSP